MKNKPAAVMREKATICRKLELYRRVKTKKKKMNKLTDDK